VLLQARDVALALAVGDLVFGYWGLVLVLRWLGLVQFLGDVLSFGCCVGGCIGIEVDTQTLQFGMFEHDDFGEP